MRLLLVSNAQHRSFKRMALRGPLKLLGKFTALALGWPQCLLFALQSPSSEECKRLCYNGKEGNELRNWGTPWFDCLDPYLCHMRAVRTSSVVAFLCGGHIMQLHTIPRHISMVFLPWTRNEEAWLCGIADLKQLLHTSMPTFGTQCLCESAENKVITLLQGRPAKDR